MYSSLLSFGDDVILKDQFLLTTRPDDNCGEERSLSIGDDVILKVNLSPSRVLVEKREV